MILTESEKQFIKTNSKILNELFQKRLVELYEAGYNLSVDDPDYSSKSKINKMFVEEMKEWLRNFKLLKDKNLDFTKSEKLSEYI